MKKYDISIETVPGITSFCAIASRTGIALSEKYESLGIIPLMRDGSNLTEALEKFDNLVVMKPSSKNKFLAEKLIEKGLENNFITVTKCGSNKEEISRDINYLKESNLPYLTTVIIKKNGLT
jgi:precorrin-2/cobalt-factor-2 C20-methyltransferase